MNLETRDIRTPIELRGTDQEEKRIAGIGAVFYRADDAETEYQLWPGAVERIMPGAFDSSLKDGDIRSAFNHDNNQLLGRTKSGTLKLSVDDRGLHYEVSPSNTQAYRDTAERIARGDVDGSSFQFFVRGSQGEKWHFDEDRNLEVRELFDVRVVEVGPVVDPAYTATTASLRTARESYEEMKKARKDSLQKEIDARQRKLFLLGLDR